MAMVAGLEGVNVTMVAGLCNETMVAGLEGVNVTMMAGLG